MVMQFSIADEDVAVLGNIGTCPVTQCHIPEDLDSSGTLHSSVPVDFNIQARAKITTALLKESSHIHEQSICQDQLHGV